MKLLKKCKCVIQQLFLQENYFLSLKRSLKPFSPIIGETYEYFDNEKNFRFYSEQLSDNPQLNAYIAETPEFVYYGDTLNTTSFKFFKGCIELLFKNKTHIHCKKTGDHYIFNYPSVYIKGLMKPHYIMIILEQQLYKIQQILHIDVKLNLLKKDELLIRQEIQKVLFIKIMKLLFIF